MLFSQICISLCILNIICAQNFDTKLILDIQMLIIIMMNEDIAYGFYNYILDNHYINFK